MLQKKAISLQTTTCDEPMFTLDFNRPSSLIPNCALVSLTTLGPVPLSSQAY